MGNPYTGSHFFDFFAVFARRLWNGMSGKLSFETLATDEIQILVLGGLALSGALVGTFLVLRRMTMLANALSHTILLGIVVAFLLSRLFMGSEEEVFSLSVPLLMSAAFITGIVTTFLTQVLTHVVHLQEDASTGLVFSVLFALGIVLVTLFSRNLHVGTELVMGNVDALHLSNIKGVFSVLAINVVLFVFLFSGYKLTSFDPGLARSFGFSPAVFSYLLMIQTSLTTIGGFRAVGVLMVLAFLVIPPLTARRLTSRLTSLIGWAVALGVSASFLGVALSRHLLTYYGIGLSTGGLVVTLLGIQYLGVLLLAPKRGIAWQALRKKVYSPT